jgi:hypothetical protein
MSTTVSKSLSTRRLVVAWLVALISVAALLSFSPARAHASENQISIMMDDDMLLYRGDAARDQTLALMKGLGVDYVRVTVLWNVVAENARSTRRRRARFKGDQPGTYPAGNWDRYDNLMRSARRFGIGVYFNVTGPGPDFAHRKAPRSHRRSRLAWWPKSREFYKFVKALGRRYSGGYRDTNQTGGVLPRVSFWSIWNEPNQGGWIAPQSLYDRSLRRMIPYSPRIYRNLYFYARKALDDTGHGSDTILIGETAPIGQSRQQGARLPISPKKFIRELLCLDRRNQPYRGRAARARGCGDFQRFGPLRASGWAHHPYTRKTPPTVRDARADSLTMANIGDLPNLLDSFAAITPRISRGLSVVLSEFGYETNPPDPFNGVSYEQQAQFITVGDFLAYANPRVAGQTQFLLRDVAPRTKHRFNSKAFWFTYQSGLFTLASQPKPAAAAYRLPFLAFNMANDPDTGVSRVGFWGQLRFRPNDEPDQVTFEFLPSGGSEWVVVGEPHTVEQRKGFFSAVRERPGPGAWRVHWSAPGGGGDVYSRVVPLG